MKSNVVLITGGTGSFGKRYAKHLLTTQPNTLVRIFSRDELKQAEMAKEFSTFVDSRRLRFFIGDVRDRIRVERAMDGVTTVIHTAAMKRVEVCEYNPFEAVQTNILGTQNLIDAALANNVEKFIALSTDKAVSPVNLYGATKLCLEKLVTSAANYAGKHPTTFAVVRYGNVLGSRGSILHTFREQQYQESFTITSKEMTRFLITFSQAIKLVDEAICEAKSGEIFVPKLPSVWITDFAAALDPHKDQAIIGLRPGEKLHEAMISEDESYIEGSPTHYVVVPHNFRSRYSEIINTGFSYSSGKNIDFLTVSEISTLISNQRTT